MSDRISSNKPHAAALLVYINGIEVPCKSASTREGVWQIPELQIEMAADPVLTRMGAEDRMQVVAFYLDDIDVDPSVKPAFRLLGEGEITSWGYRNTPSGRSIVFTCINQIAIFTQLFVQFMTNVDDMVAHATFMGGTTTTFATASSELVFPFSLFTNGLIPSPGAADPGHITRPFDFLYNTLRGMVDANVPDAQRSVPAANFFGRWSRLTNFINRFAGSPVFDEGTGDKNIFPALKALQNTSAVDLLTRNLIPQVQNAGSIYDMLQLVYQTVFMEIAMIPSMPLVTTDLKTGIVEETAFEKHVLTTQTTAGSTVNGVKQATKALPPDSPNPLKPKRLQNYFSKPQFIFGLPPTCNVIFPSQIKMYSYDENYATQPTRLYFNDEVLNLLFKSPDSGLGQVITNALATAYPPEANAANQERVANPKTNGKNFLLFPEELFKGPVMDRRPIPPWMFFMRNNQNTKKNADEGAAQNETPSGAPTAQQDFYDNIKSQSPDIYALYAQYEFFRERYSRRSGGVALAWNPYIVPGFPMAIFDDRASRVDVFAYVLSVSKTLSNTGSASTEVSFTYGRTVQEAFDLLAQDFERGAPVAAVGPREPLYDVRVVIQDFKAAEAYYKKLFNGDRRLFNKDASFDWRKVIGYAPTVPGQMPEHIFIDGVSEADLKGEGDARDVINDLVPKLQASLLATAKITALKDATNKTIKEISAIQNPSTLDLTRLDVANSTLTAASIELDYLKPVIVELQAKLNAATLLVKNNEALLAKSSVVHNLDGTREIAPLAAAQGMFNGYDAAMRYNWRPICTLDEYVIFHDSAGEDIIPAAGHERSVGARYYGRIRRLRPLTPDTVVPSGADGLNAPTVANTAQATAAPANAATGDSTVAPSTVASVPGLDATFPQTRADWDKILVAYRNNVYFVKAPRR